MGQLLSPLQQSVSGGLSKLVSIHRHLAKQTSTPCFDEVDTGIGGKTADIGAIKRIK